MSNVMLLAEVNSSAEWAAAACFSFLGLCVLIAYVAKLKYTGKGWEDE